MKLFIRVILCTHMATDSIDSHCCRNTPQFHCSPELTTKDHRQTGQKNISSTNKEMPQKIMQQQRLCPDS